MLVSGWPSFASLLPCLNELNSTVYLNSLLATLHSREGLLEKLNDVVLSDIVLNKDQSMKPLSKLKFAAFEVRFSPSTRGDFDDERLNTDFGQETNGASLQGGNHVPLSQK